jgi:LPS O-antigen subunit length determinant protein (WzzB/FepE family)
MAAHDIVSNRKQAEIHEISLAEIFAFVKRHLAKAILTGAFFGVFGYAISFLLPVSYVSQSILLPESANSASGMGSLSSLARLGGLTRNESIGALQPDLYPTILQTIPFSLYLLKQPVVDKDNRSYKSVEAFLHRNDDPEESERYTNNTKQKLSKDILSLSKGEDLDTKYALRLISTLYDIKTGLITISSESPDPVVSAQLVQLASNYLIEYVSEYRTQKTKTEVQFLGERVSEAKKRQQSAELALQSYKDRNRNPFLNVARIEEQRLQADFLLSQSLFSDIVRKYEEARIKVKEEQPIIKILEPAKVPLVKSKPNRLVMALVSAFSGLVLSVLFFFVKSKYLI